MNKTTKGIITIICGLLVIVVATAFTATIIMVFP